MDERPKDGKQNSEKVRSLRQSFLLYPCLLPLARDQHEASLVTSDSKTVTKMAWGALPSADFAEADEEESLEEDESGE
jgi:hypothetical protein